MLRIIIFELPMVAKLIVAVWASWLTVGSVWAQAVPAPVWSYSVIAQYPHTTSAFTEGLLIHDGKLVESTGLYGASALAIRELRSGKLLTSVQLPPGDFGEGLALLGPQLFQLTWREGTCHVYDQNLKLVRNLSFSGEGWGLASDGHELIRSDGTPELHFHDPKDFHETHVVTVRDAGQPVALINELEWVSGHLFANVWTSDRIAIIDPLTGIVTGWLDLDGLKLRFTLPPHWDSRDDVLNGIAFDPVSGHLFVTGKRWPLIFEIAISPPRTP